MSKPGSTNIPRKQKCKKRYQNVVSEVYTNVINALIEPLQEEFTAAGCDVSTLQTLCTTWYDKIKTTKAVESLLVPEFRKHGALSASERAKAIAKRDMEVAYERMSCTNVQLVGKGPTTSPVITAQGNIVQRQKSDINDQRNNDTDISIRAGVGKAEWSYPPDALNAQPDSLVLYTLKLPMPKTQQSVVQARKFNVRLPASIVQNGKLDTLVDKQLLQHMTRTSISSANALLQGHIQTKLTLENHNSKRIRLAHQLDGNFSDSDDCFDFGNPFELRQTSDGIISSSDDTLSTCSDAQLEDKRRKRISSKSKSYLKELFHLCTSSSSSEENLKTEKETKVNRKKMKLKALKKKSQSQSLKSCDFNLLDCQSSPEQDAVTSANSDFGCSGDHFTANNTAMTKLQDYSDEDPSTAKLFVDGKPEEYWGKQKEMVEDDACKSESGEVLNSGDELSSLESDEETENLCICLFDKVRRRKSKWRMQLRSGIMNIKGGDYVFDFMDVHTAW